MARAAALYFGEKSEDAPVIMIGRDTRISGTMFEAALVSGIISAGGHIICCGVLPTPAIAYLVKKHNATAGIVISASHNPFQDNGIKFFGGDGYKLPDSVEDEIEGIVRGITLRNVILRYFFCSVWFVHPIVMHRIARRSPSSPPYPWPRR